MKKLVAAALVAISVGGAASAGALEWKYGETADAMSDQKYARTFADGDTGRLGIKCDSPGADSLYVHYIANEYLGGRGGGPGRRELMFRFDDDAPAASSWSYDGRSAVLSDDAAVWAFVKRLETAKKLAIRAQTYEYRQVTTIIDVSNVGPTLAKVVEACKALRR